MGDRDCQVRSASNIFFQTYSAHSHPGPFEYSIIPRSAEAIALIRSVYEEHPVLPSDGPKLL
jgi:hypothetical protein